MNAINYYNRKHLLQIARICTREHFQLYDAGKYTIATLNRVTYYCNVGPLMLEPVVPPEGATPPVPRGIRWKLTCGEGSNLILLYVLH